MYSIIKKLLFYLEAEKSHKLSLNALKIINNLHLLPKKDFYLPTKVMGLNLPNPIGLAAGVDKNGQYIDALAKLGFGFIEIGTITPKAQLGNPKPRLFRLQKCQAIINNMGFNNYGVDHLVNNVKKSKYNGILGINIGKNYNTTIENATQDYIFCLEKIYNLASYVVINISSPNTDNLRTLQEEDKLSILLNKLKQKQNELANKNNKYIPLTIKIAPDLNNLQIKNIADILIDSKIDGIIATNTTINKNLLDTNLNSILGGLSGKPLLESSNVALSHLASNLNNKIPIIGVGGITQGKDAKQKFQLGAKAIELYTGIIYKGPKLIKDCFIELKNFNRRGG